MNLTLTFKFVLLVILLNASVILAEAKKHFVPHELLVKFRSQVSTSGKINRIKSMGHSSLQQTATFSHVKISDKEDLLGAMKDYQGASDVEWVQPNYIYYKSAVPNDPSIGQEWGLSNTGQTIVAANSPHTPFTSGNPGTSGKDISAFSAWNYLTDCSATIVAVVDTGVNYNHQDLAANMWDGGTAYPNHGWNYVDGNNDPMDKNGHGSHVAGTIGAVGNNGIGTTGVCWKAKIMAVRVLDASGSGTTVHIMNGINFAVQNGAKVVNMSLGGSDFDPLTLTAIQAARNAGVVIVAAAGNDSVNNDSTPSYPCNYQEPNVICVAALNQTFALASYSNYGGSSVAVGAPGTNILSSWSGLETKTTETLSNTAGWTFTPPTGQTGAWGITTVNLDFGSVTQATQLLANPANWNGTNKYSNNIDSVAYKNYDLSNQDAASGDFSLFLNTESTKDFFRVYCKATGGDPSSGGVLVSSISGQAGNTAIDYPQDFSACLSSNATIGFQITSDAANATTGIAILPFSLTTMKLNSATYSVISGTSMATPHVAGIVAMVQSYNPSYTMQEVVNAVKFGGVTTTSLVGKTATGKAVNAMGSLAYLQTPTGVTVVK